MALTATFSGCESESRMVTHPVKVRTFATLFTEIVFEPEEEMVSSCEIECQQVRPNGYRQDLSFVDRKIYRDTINITGSENYPMQIQFYLDATPKAGLKDTISLKYCYGLTLTTQDKDLTVIDGITAGDAFYEREIEPDSLAYILRNTMPVTITAIVSKDGTITLIK